MTPKEFSDGSNGYESVAGRFMSHRSQSRVGVDTVREWAKCLPRGAVILDLGCGNGRPVSQVFFDEGFTVYGLDASASMIAAFQAQFPVLKPNAAELKSPTSLTARSMLWLRGA